MAAMGENYTFAYGKIFMMEYIELTINALSLYTQSMQRSPTRLRDTLAIIFLTIIVFTSSVRLISTDWTPDLEVARNVSLLGLLLGLALGISRLKKIGVILFTLSFSVLVVPWQILSITDKEPLLITRITKGSSRLLYGFNQLAERQPVDDHIFFIMLMVMIFWFTGLYASYIFVRYQNIIATLFPSTLIILIIQYYDQTSETSFWSIGIYFLFVLILLGRLNFLNDKKRWKKENVFTDPGIGFDISIITLSAIAIIVLFAWSIPSSRAEWAAIASWWQNSTGSLTDTQKQLGNALASIDEKTVEDSGDLYKSRLLLGERPYQNNQTLFTARVLDGRLAQRYYWKLRVYDTYKDGYWSHSQDTLTRFIPSMVDIRPPNTDTSFFQEFVFTNKIPSQSVLLTVQQPINISSNTQAVYTPLPDGTMDISRLLAQSSLNSNESYTIKSALAEPTIANMRQAGTEYPDWVVERYLQLPKDFPESIRELVAELSLNQETPYDIAFAITSYLRAEIFYDEEIPSPPRDQDPIEWFLFTWKRGFCNYSASANVVMLRAVGIPARLAVGFAQGDRDEQGDFLIQQSDAHTWPEVYFPDLGWVEFEPTPSERLFIRPSGSDAVGSNELGDMLSGRILHNLDKDGQIIEDVPLSDLEHIFVPESVDPTQQTDGRISSLWGMIVLMLVVVLFGIWYFDRKQILLTFGLQLIAQVYKRTNISVPALLIRWMRWSEAMPITRAFHGVNVSLGLLGEKIPLHFTPQERASALAKLIPTKEDEINALLAEHQKSLFTPEEGDLKIARRTSLAIRWHSLKTRISSF